MRWYVLRSKPNREEALWREVDARGYQSFYPHVRVQPANPRAHRVRPYFPGYLFVQANLADVGNSVFAWMPYSQGLVAFGEEPAEVPEALVQAIRRRVEETNLTGGEKVVGLARGDRVIIQGGPFDGYGAVFDACVQGQERVRVLLKILQAEQIRLELPRGQIQRATRI